MSLTNGSDVPIISSLDELEGKVVGWTLFAGRPLRAGEGSGTLNTIQLPQLHWVVRGKLEEIFETDIWIGDEEGAEWERAEGMLLRRGIRQIWSPVIIRLGSFLLGPGEPPESHEGGQIYRHEGIEDAQHGSNPENMFDTVEVLRFIEKSQ